MSTDNTKQSNAFDICINKVANALIELQAEAFRTVDKTIPNIHFPDYIMGTTSIFVNIVARSATYCVAESKPDIDLNKFFQNYLEEIICNIRHVSLSVELPKDVLREVEQQNKAKH